MELEKMDENEWKYHGEGNKSLVVSHVQHCQVLRFLKFPMELVESNQASEAFCHLQNIVDFGKHIMKPLLGESYVHYGEVVQLPLDFVPRLFLKIQSERPESRCNKIMDTLSGYALCLPNLTRLQTCHFIETQPTLCIEIKPKCGFLPFSSHVSKEIKRRVCRYCMYQRLKVANGKWKKISKYCPLDLFSGNKQRMCFALTSLLQEAQNNLKIFKNGELIYGCKDVHDCLPDLNELAQQLKPFFFPANGLHCKMTVINELINVITTALLSNSDSCRVGDMRRSHFSESRTYCEASHFCKDILRNGKFYYCYLLILHTTFYCFVTLSLHFMSCRKSLLQIDGPYNEIFTENLLNFHAEDDGSVEYAATKVQQYRVAMTAKDCSIMITLSPYLQEEKPEQSTVINASKSRFAFSVSILDLDPKPYENIPNQFKLDGKIVNYYLKSTQTKQDPASPNIYKENEDCTLVLHAV
nr:PREDICTED: inositol-pentakisphosphate 2-kinase [Latimeria chalumnae]|eukprot:XP_005987157.1 PREDICTED: inositol-pentakisphosphate 2-kinase [Latimeria chalumnae]